MRLSCLALGEHFLRDQRCRSGIGPAAIEREMRDGFDDLLALHAVVERAPEVAAQLVGTRERDERCHGNQAAVALRQSGALPHIAEDHLVGELTQLRKDVSDLADGGRRRRASHANLPGKWCAATLSCSVWTPRSRNRLTHGCGLLR